LEKPIKILLVEDSEDDAILLIREVSKGGYTPVYHRIENAEQMAAALQEDHWDLVITDYSLPTFSGIDALEMLGQQDKYIPAIMVSGKMGEEAAVEAMRAGASDYIIKGNYARLVPAIDRELRDAEIRRERHDALDQLRKNEIRYRAIVEDQTELINRYTLDGTITFVNNAFARLHGKTPEELIGKKHLEFVSEESYKKLLLIRSQLSRQKPFYSSEQNYVLPDGREIWLQWFDRLIFDKDDNPIEFQGVGRDITEIKRAENDLKTFADNLERYAVQLQVAAEIARDAATARDLTSLLNRAIDLVRERFGFYHAGVFLLDEQGEYAVLTAATGEAGQKLLEQKHKLKVGVEGIIGLVAQKGQPRMALDVKLDSYHLKQPLLPDTRAEIAVPLRLMGRVIGVFDVQSRRTYGFDSNDLIALQTMADQLAVAIENARLYEAQEKRAAELESLRQVSLGLTSSLEPKSVLDAVLDGVFKLMPNVGDAHIFVYDKGRLIFGSSLFQDGTRGKVFSDPRPSGLTYTVAQSGEMVVVDDFQTHPIYEGIAKEKGWTGSVVGMPVKIGERVVGVLNVVHPQTFAFTEVELRVLRLLGDQAALAIENARLFEQTTRERGHLSLLYDVGQAMASTFDPDAILEHALELTCRSLRGGIGATWIYALDGDCLVMRALFDQDQGIVSLADRPQSELMLDLAHQVIGWVVRERQTINLPDAPEDKRWTDIPLFGSEIHSVIAAPILESKNTIGVMAISRQQADSFTNDHMDLLQSICQQTGLALSNARHYQDINRLVDLLAAEQYRLESLIEMLPSGVLLLDESQNILVTNPLSREILTVLSPTADQGPLTQLGPMPITELFAHQDDLIPLEIAIEEPKRAFYEVQARPIGGESAQWVLTLRDVTQEREIQEHIQMQNRLATVGQLAAGIAHDFNNIMAAIVVYADLLMMEPNLSKSSQERLSIIQQQVQRASSLIRQILDFSRRSVMEQITLDLLPFVKEIEKLLERTLPETMRLEMHFKPGEYIVKADPTRLQQVFMNLAVNARDAMIDGGKLCFELTHYKCSSQDSAPVMEMPPGNWVQVSVSDTGAGISPDDLTRVFEPFFTTKPAGQGTGLGLAQVYGIVRQHEGFIHVDSQPGKGTRFDIYLPSLAEPTAELNGQRDQSKFDGTGKTILLVEDDATTRTAMETLLDSLNFKVLVTENGKEAVKLLEVENESVSLVISDIVMPQMGGMDLYTVMQIRWPDIMMLFVTGHPLNSDDQEILEQGRVDWLQKPFSINDFNQALRKFFEEP
jgi:PAS domain S-box-containing protein